MKCTICSTEGTGAFCAGCGAAMNASCKACDAPFVAGARFCTQCGLPIRRTHHLPWIVAGVAVGVAILALLAPILFDRQPGMSFARQGTVSGTAQPFTGQAPPLTGSLREQADRLFNRVMEANQTGDREQAEFFLPMAVEAYRQAGPLDADGLFHLSLLETLAGQPAAGRATAERILADQPNHLLALAAAAEAAQAAGDADAALHYHRRFLDAWADESGRDLREYLDHARMLPEYRAAAYAAAGDR
jgi:hypothetical protein